MTTSSSDRCTRISPSAVLDDRLDGKDLEWARDHLRRCEACRERVEDFREMLLRVGRLPKATVGAAAMDEAYGLSVPERLREEAGIRSYEVGPPDTSRMVTPIGGLPPSMQPDLASIPDLMSALEREIFRDEPSHPTPMETLPEPIYPTFARPPEQEVADVNVEHEETAAPESPEVEPLSVPEPIAEAEPDAEPQSLREVPIDSHRDDPLPTKPSAPEETDWARLLETIANAPASEAEPAPEPSWLPPVPAASSSVRDQTETEASIAEAPPPPPVQDQLEHTNVVFDQEPALSFDDGAAAAPEAEAAETSPRRPGPSDRVMRIAVGFGAAACLLLAALLYEGGYFLKMRPTAGTTPVATARASVKASASAAVHHSASPTAAPTPTPPPATVLYSLGNGVAGDTVFRIRPGTAIAGYTRLVFDMHGNGLPSMVVAQADPLHVVVTFMNTSADAVAVNGIHSYQVAGVEPAVQSGANASFTIDLARPVHVTAFTLAATGSYAWRLVVDLHTI